ncbi:MAG: M20/M25/M40 family metallo-hydrolase [Deltaproteobacteria bacterium]|nr:M20/M25/M40 family metallo-hydrolase [Deltaproteobacteria bacterium]
MNWIELEKSVPPPRAEEVVNLLCELINIPSVTGTEQQIAEFLVGRMRELGLESRLQEIEPGRSNAIGVLRGSGDGPALVFNGHLDTATSGRIEEDYAGLGEVVPGNLPQAYIKDGHVYGLGAYNMKGGIAAAVCAVGTLAKSGVKLRGDVIIAAVAGESEKAPVDGALRSFRGPGYRGGGVGTRYYITHGPVPDMAIVCEPTALWVTNADAGYLWVKLIVKGTGGRPADRGARTAVSAVSVMTRVVQAIEAWAPEYRDSHVFDSGIGKIEPTVNVGAVEGGFPFKASYKPAVCHIYVELRLTPSMRPTLALDELRIVLNRLQQDMPELHYDLEVYASNFPSTVTSPETRVVQTALEMQKRVLGEEQNNPPSRILHFWNDTNVFRQHGIPAVMVGPGGERDVSLVFEPGQHVAIQQLKDAARLYTLAAIKLCTLSRAEALD